MSLEPVLRKILKGLPNYPHFGTHPTFLVILNPFRLFFRPLTQAWAKLYWGTGHTVIVYIPTACTTKNLERIPPMNLVSGQVLFLGSQGAPWGPSKVPLSPFEAL